MPAMPLPITTNFCLFTFSSMLCLLILVPMVRRDDADLHRRLAKVLMIGERPSAGKGSSTMTIEISGIQDTCQHRARIFPGATHGFSRRIVNWLHLRVHECTKNHPIGLSIVHNTNA
jgi:hypothetical protein